MDEKNKEKVEQEEVIDSLSNYNLEFCSDFVKSISKITENYKNMEKSIVTQLLLETPGHHLTTGTYRETVWKSLFELIVPKKFYIEQGVFIIDSFGRISREVDLAIFDEMYTPYIFNYGKIKFIPIEAIAVVVQCKSKSLKIEELEEWIESIDSLQTSMNSIARVMTNIVDSSKIKNRDLKKKTQTATRPIRILSSTLEGNIRKEIASMFDISLNIEGDKLIKTIARLDDDLNDWYKELNHYKVEKYDAANFYQKLIKKEGDLKRKLSDLKVVDNEDENVIMSLTFQLNQLLMLLNNPIPFPHQAYVDMFNGVLKKNAKKKGGSTDGK